MTKVINTGMTVHFRNGFAWEERKLYKKEYETFTQYFVKYQGKEYDVEANYVKVTGHYNVNVGLMNSTYVVDKNGFQYGIFDTVEELHKVFNDMRVIGN